MEENGGQNRRREITLTLGPLKVTLRGYDVLITLLIAGLAALVVFVYKSNEAFAEEHKDLLDSNQRQEEAFAEMVYVLTLDPEDRKKLKLEMPKSLRERVRN